MVITIGNAAIKITNAVDKVYQKLLETQFSNANCRYTTTIYIQIHHNLQSKTLLLTVLDLPLSNVKSLFEGSLSSVVTKTASNSGLIKSLFLRLI